MLSAKARSSLRPLPLSLQVDRYARRLIDHKIYWSGQGNKREFQMWNDCTIPHNKPCMRRWMEFRGKRVPKHMNYVTCYTPPSIDPDPDRIWELCIGSEAIATFSNVGEAWLICLALRAFEDEPAAVVYISRV